MKDLFGRKINYLRISLTDRCNLKCFYCKTRKEKKNSQNKILTLKELQKIIKVSKSLGINKFRITGGEPLLRKDLSKFISFVSNIKGVNLSLSTNGVFLKRDALKLFDAGLRKINISLDTLNEEKYRFITGFNYLSEVISGVKIAKEIGFSPVKINTVLMRGINDDELDKFINFVKEYSLELRFIEIMPLDGRKLWKKYFISADEVVKNLEKDEKLNSVYKKKGEGPAKYYYLEKSKIRIGVIDSVSNPFCSTCNRLRITSSGLLKPCLFSKKEIDLKNILRNAGEKKLKNILKEAIMNKPEFGIHREFSFSSMAKIGG